MSATERVARSPVAGLAALVALSSLLHIALVSRVHGPWIFSDELGYERLAQSIGETGRLALFGHAGLSYSPLYPAVLSPLYAFHLSALQAYHWSKIVNCVLLALAAVPIYGIARFALSRAGSLLAAAVCSLAPLMFYSSMIFSENLAYPLFLCTVWAMLVAVRSPSGWHDGLLLVTMAAACAARIEFILLMPAALGAVLLAAVLEPTASSTFATAVAAPARDVPHRLLGALRRHLLLTAAAVVFVVALAAAAAGTGVESVAGPYQSVRSVSLRSPARIVLLGIQHLAEFDLAVGVIPFAAAVVAAYVWFRCGRTPDRHIFAVVALSVTFFSFLETAVVAYYLESTVEVRRIHERYLVYLVPFFVIALLALGRRTRWRTTHPVYLAAVLIAGLLPAAVPYGDVVNNTIVADAFGLAAFSRTVGHAIVPIDHVRLASVLIALSLATLALLLRQRGLVVVGIVAFLFLFISALVRVQIEPAAGGAASILAPHRDWVDRVGAGPGTALIAGPRVGILGALAINETAFNNLTVSRLYTTCGRTLDAVFGQRQIRLDGRGVMRVDGRPLRARYAVVPAGSGVVGRVVARAPRARLVLVETPDAVVRVAERSRPRWTC